MFALTEQGSLYESTDHALTWTERASPKAHAAVSNNLLLRGVRLAADRSDTVYVCSDAGLWSLASGTSEWMQVGPASEGKCSDVVIDNGAVYAAFRGVGVVQLTFRIVVFGGHAQATSTWLLLKAAARTSEFPDDPIRFALGPGSMLVSEGCDVCGSVTVWFDLRSNLSGPNPTATWGNPIATLPESTGGGPGYSISAAMSPSGRTLIAGGRGACDLQQPDGAERRHHIPFPQDHA